MGQKKIDQMFEKQRFESQQVDPVYVVEGVGKLDTEIKDPEVMPHRHTSPQGQRSQKVRVKKEEEGRPRKITAQEQQGRKKN